MFLKRRIKISGFTAALAATLLLASSMLAGETQPEATEVCASDAVTHPDRAVTRPMTS